MKSILINCVKKNLINMQRRDFSKQRTENRQTRFLLWKSKPNKSQFDLSSYNGNSYSLWIYLTHAILLEFR